MIDQNLLLIINHVCIILFLQSAQMKELAISAVGAAGKHLSLYHQTLADINSLQDLMVIVLI